MRTIHLPACCAVAPSHSNINETLAFYRIMRALPGHWEAIDQFLTAIGFPAAGEEEKSPPRPGYVERYPGDGAQPYYFRIKAANGETLVHSEGYSSPEAREVGIAALRNAAINGEGWEGEA